jgi:hypothetical protein
MVVVEIALGRPSPPHSCWLYLNG